MSSPERKKIMPPLYDGMTEREKILAAILRAEDALKRATDGLPEDPSLPGSIDYPIKQSLNAITSSVAAYSFLVQQRFRVELEAKGFDTEEKLEKEMKKIAKQLIELAIRTVVERAFGKQG
jgi:hypothetical protein